MRSVPVLLAAVALTAAACSPNGTSGGAATTTPGIPADSTSPPPDGPADTTGGGGGVRFPRALTPFDDCDTFLDHVRGEAGRRVGPYGLQGDPWIHWMEGDVVMAGDESVVDVAAGAEESTADSGSPAGRFEGGLAAGDAGADTEFTGTNVQELGIDEPDIVKTDGERIIAVSGNRLTYVDVVGDPVVTDTVDLPEGWGHELFIRGDRALLFTNGGEWFAPMPVDVAIDSTDAEAEFAAPDEDVGVIAPDRFGPASVIVEIDLSDPTDLEVVGTLRIQGQYLSARAIDERVRLVVTTPPSELPWLYPQNQNGEDLATEANREIVDRSTLDDWLPSYELTVGDTSSSGSLLACDRAHRPADFSGFDMITVVDLDLDDGLDGAVDRTSAVGVMAGGQTVYSSNDRLYVATTEWAGADLVVDDSTWLEEWNEDFETEIHAFAISPTEPTRYVASGSMEGSLLNQFSLDEHDGYLRAITTRGSPWTREATSESHLVVFEEQGDRLTPVGEVGGLGKGEQLHSARLMGDVGFAVTFRQIDPFYVLDLSDPTNPRVTGELKIPGVSTYLHPVGDDRVLGIGQDATEEGMTTGLKLSLFDVADPTAPQEIAVWTVDGATSPAEWDHRAFQMWGTTAIVPVQTWDQTFNGAVLVEVGDGIDEIGRITHVGDDGVPSSDCRTLTADDVPVDSEFWWMVNEGGAHLQLCEETDRGGFGTWFCEEIPLDQAQSWLESGAVVDDTDPWPEAADGARIEMCWPDGGHQEAIQRSLVIDGTVWTMTPSALQANAVDGLEVVAQLPLG